MRVTPIFAFQGNVIQFHAYSACNKVCVRRILKFLTIVTMLFIARFQTCRVYRRAASRVALLSATAILTACATPSAPPPPVVPAISLSTENFANAPSSIGMVEGSPVWWAQFNDPNLTALIDLALENNTSLDVASANIDTARAITARTELGASYNTTTTLSPQIRVQNRSSNLDVQTNFGGGLSASWEYDAFGRIAAAIKAAELNEQALEDARRDVAVIVASDVASAYIDLRGAQARAAVAQNNARAQEQTLGLLQDLVDNGRSTELDLRRSQAQYRTTLASIPRFMAAIDGAKARLAALTGQAANDIGAGAGTITGSGTINDIAARMTDIPQHSGALQIGSAPDMLRRRPDIRRAETLIAQSLALGEVERARLFPTVIFNGNLSSLFNNGGSIGLGFGPAIRWDGPDLRGVRADIDIADAQTLALVASYEDAVINALSEVEITLSAYAREMERQDDLRAAVTAARAALDLARIRFDEGLDDFLDVLDAQRTLLDTEDRLVESQQFASILAVRTYRVLGGVWDT